MNEGGGAVLLLGPFVARSLTPVPLSFLLNRTETLATQATLSGLLHSRVFNQMDADIII